MLYWFVFPWIIRNYSAPVNQKTAYKVVARFPSLERIKHLIYGDYDIYFSSGLYSVNSQIAFIITKLRGKKNGVLVKEFHFRKHNLLARINNVFTKLIGAKRNFYIAYSTQSYTFLEKRLSIPNTRIHYIPKTRKDYSTIEFDENRLKKIRNLYFKNDKINILFLGRVVPVKGVDVLLESILPLNDKVHVVIAEDPHRTGLSHILSNGSTKENNENIHITEVQAVSLGRFIHKENIDPGNIGMIKIDVEGHEYLILKGMKSILKKTERLLSLY